MNTHAREILPALIVLLLVAVLPAGAANRSPLRLSARFDTTGKISGQVPQGWISSSSYDSSKGTLTIDFAPGVFSTTPSCTVIPNSISRPSRLSSDGFPQPSSIYPDGIIIVGSIVPKGNAHLLPASQLVCVGLP